MTRKKFLLLICMLIVLGLTGCGVSTAKSAAPGEKPSVPAAVDSPVPSAAYYTLLVAESLFDTVDWDALEAARLAEQAAREAAAKQAAEELASQNALAESEQPTPDAQIAQDGQVAPDGQGGQVTQDARPTQNAQATPDAQVAQGGQTTPDAQVAQDGQVTPDAQATSDVRELEAQEKQPPPEEIPLPVLPPTFGVLSVYDTTGAQYQPVIYDDIGADTEKNGSFERNVRVYAYLIPFGKNIRISYLGANESISGIYGADAESQTLAYVTDNSRLDTQVFPMIGSRTFHFRVGWGEEAATTANPDGEAYVIPVAEQAYYTLDVVEALYNDTPQRKGHAAGQLLVTDLDSKEIYAVYKTTSGSDFSRKGGFKNNLKTRTYLIPPGRELKFVYAAGNKALQTLDCDELYPNPLLNYVLDGTQGVFEVTRLTMQNNHVIHIRAGWGSEEVASR